MILTWNVFKEDWNGKEITTFNVFQHQTYKEEIERLLEAARMGLSKGNFEKEVRRYTQYYFWSKSEYEIVLTSWPPYIDADKELARLIKDKEDTIAKGWTPKFLDVRMAIANKIDIYEQLQLNWEHYINYLWRMKDNAGD